VHRLLVVTALLTVTLAPAAHAQRERPIPEPLQEGTPIVIVGQVSDTPGTFGGRKMQVEVGETRRDYTLHYRDAVIKGPAGEKMSSGDIDEGQWVRAEGRVMNDERRVWVERLRVITPEEAQTIRNTAFYRPGYPYGYVAVTDESYYARHYGRDWPGNERYAERETIEERAGYREGPGYTSGTYRTGYTNGNDRYYEAPQSRVLGTRTVYRTRTVYVPRRPAK
jgi:hypothetical protein